MAHFAELDENNVVIKIHYVNNECILDENGECCDELGHNICCDVCGHDRFVQASINSNIRGRFPKVGDVYDENLDVFILPKPQIESWILDETTGEWIPPDPKPELTDGICDWCWLENLYQETGIGWYPMETLPDPYSDGEFAYGYTLVWNDETLKFESVEQKSTIVSVPSEVVHFVEGEDQPQSQVVDI